MKDLDAAEAEARFSAMFAGEMSDEEIERLLVALHEKGETPDEILGAARAAQRVRIPFDAGGIRDAIDTCGTGGDGLNTFNVSTAVALAAAAMGIVVIKHGNRAASSRCGSADVLEALGIPVERDDAAWRQELATRRFAFLFAPRFHPSFKRVAAVRKRLAHRTVFNLLGPLLNPADVERQVLGVFDARWVEPLAQVLAGLGRKHAFVVHGGIGLAPTDELAPWGESRVAEVRDGAVRTFSLELGREGATPEDVAGGDATRNAGLIREVLAGRGHATAQALVAMNLAAAMVVAGRAATVSGALPAAEDFLRAGSTIAHFGLH